MTKVITNEDQKVAKAQRKIVQALELQREIKVERNAHRREEYVQANADIKKGRGVAQFWAKKSFVQHVKNMLLSGYRVYGHMSDSTYYQVYTCNLKPSFESVTEPAFDFEITNAHLGRKHVGFHVHNSETGEADVWIRASEFDHKAKLVSAVNDKGTPYHSDMPAFTYPNTYQGGRWPGKDDKGGDA